MHDPERAAGAVAVAVAVWRVQGALLLVLVLCQVSTGVPFVALGLDWGRCFILKAPVAHI